ncbi:MAG: hypothetical protein H6721_01065 [Sandaracinus sp.]|nr:hypothetical protein [Sandaracinus sp.]
MRFAVLASLVVLLGARSVAAHEGRFPETQQLLFDGDTLVGVATTVGLMVPSDEGWRWTCRSGIGLRDQEDPIWARADGRFVVASFDGIVLGDPCAFDYVPALRRQVVLDVHRAANGRFFAVTSNGSGPNALWTSEDGEAWIAGANLPLPALFERVRTAPSNPDVVYLSGFEPPEEFGGVRDALIWASTDGGATFEERRLTLLPGEVTLFLLEVDATNPSRLFARTLRDLAARSIFERVLESDDGGATWSTRFEVPLFGAFARRGTTTYVGGRDPGEPPPVPGAPPRELGLWRAEDGADFTHVFTGGQVKCLNVRDDGLFACLGGASPFVVGRSNDDGAGFTSLLAWSEVTGPVECGVDAPTPTRCVPEEDGHNREHFGLLDAGVDGGTSGGGGGCSTSSRPEGRAWLLLGLVGFRRPRRSRSKNAA